MSDLRLPEALIADSDAALFDTLTQGMGEAMPAFADTLNEDERWNVVAFTRTLSLSNAAFSDAESISPAATREVEIAAAPETTAGSESEAANPAATPEVNAGIGNGAEIADAGADASDAAVFGTVSGQVSNTSADGQVPDDLTVTLDILDSTGVSETRESTVNADGTYIFEDVPFSGNRGYMVTTTYQDRLFGSDLVQAAPFAASLDLPFSIYEITDDRSVIQTDDIVLQLTRADNTLQITQIMSYSNLSDRMYSRGEQVSDRRFASIVVPLPLGARLLEFADAAQRYVFAENLTALIDTQPVLPGENHIIHVLYALPFQEGMTVDIPLEYPLDGRVSLLVQEDTLSVSSEQLPSLGIQTLGGTAFQSYGSTVSLQTGDGLLFSVSSVTTNPLAGILESNGLLPAVLIVIGSLSMLIAAALYYFGCRRQRRQRRQTPS